MHTRRTFQILSIGLLLGVVCVLLYILVTTFTTEELTIIAQKHRVAGAILIALVMCATTVIAPLTSLPLVFMVAPFLGPFTTAVACFTGWTLGAVIAFVIGRLFGQPIVTYLFGKDALKRYESYVQPRMSFWTIVMLRIALPVDLVSYALGTLSNVSFRIYVPATMIGVTWFSIFFSYLGEAAYSRHYVLFVALGVASVLILFFAHNYVKRKGALKTGGV